MAEAGTDGAAGKPVEPPRDWGGVLGLVGLSAIAIGASGYDWRIGCVVIGSILFVLAVIGALRK